MVYDILCECIMPRPTKENATRLMLTLLAILIPIASLSSAAAFAQLQNLTQTQNQNFSQPQILNLTPPAGPVTLKILSQNAFTENNPYLQANPSLQTLHIVGEVQNNSTDPAQNVQLTIVWPQ
jgi:predicted PurR-regulated permease PerM